MTPTVEEIIKEAQQLPPEEQQRLLDILTGLLTSAPQPSASLPPAGPYAFSLALAGSAHSDFTDTSADKYRHLAEACRDR